MAEPHVQVHIVRLLDGGTVFGPRKDEDSLTQWPFVASQMGSYT